LDLVVKEGMLLEDLLKVNQLLEEVLALVVVQPLLLFFERAQLKVTPTGPGKRISNTLQSISGSNPSKFIKKTPQERAEPKIRKAPKAKPLTDIINKIKGFFKNPKKEEAKANQKNLNLPGQQRKEAKAEPQQEPTLPPVIDSPSADLPVTSPPLQPGPSAPRTHIPVRGLLRLVEQGSFSLPAQAKAYQTPSAISRVLELIGGEAVEEVEVNSSFEQDCIETCILAPTEEEYTLLIEVDPGTSFELDSISYTVYE